MPKESSHCICLSVIFWDSVFKMDETLPRKKKIKKYINNDLQISSDDSEKE